MNVIYHIDNTFYFAETAKSILHNKLFSIFILLSLLQKCRQKSSHSVLLWPIKRQKNNERRKIERKKYQPSALLNPCTFNHIFAFLFVTFFAQDTSNVLRAFSLENNWKKNEERKKKDLKCIFLSVFLPIQYIYVTFSALSKRCLIEMNIFFFLP